MAQQQGDVPAAKAWFLRGVRGAWHPASASGQAPDAAGALMCWEGYAELLAFLGQRDAARRAFQGGAASAVRVQYVAAAAPRASSVSGDAEEMSSPDQGDEAANQDKLWPLLEQYAGGTSNSAPPPALVQDSSNGKSTTSSSSQSHSQHLTRPGLSQHGGSSSRGSQRDLSLQLPRGHSNSDGNSHANLSSGNSGSSTTAVDSLLRWVESGTGPAPEYHPSYPGCSARFLRQWALLEKKLGNVEEAGKLFTAAARKDPQVGGGAVSGCHWLKLCALQLYEEFVA
jgi:hypothetical protein